MTENDIRRVIIDGLTQLARSPIPSACAAINPSGPRSTSTRSISSRSSSACTSRWGGDSRGRLWKLETLDGMVRYLLPKAGPDTQA